jgi:hypothetical protein
VKNRWDVKEIKVALKGYKIEESAIKQTGLGHVRKWDKKWMEHGRVPDSIQQYSIPTTGNHIAISPY